MSPFPTTTFLLHPVLFSSHSSALPCVTHSDKGGVRAFLGLPLNPVNVTMEQWPFKIVYIPANLLFHLSGKFQPSQHVDFLYRCLLLKTIQFCRRILNSHSRNLLFVNLANVYLFLPFVVHVFQLQSMRMARQARSFLRE